MTPCQFPVTSSKRTSPMVPNMELPNRQRMYNKAKDMLQKARQPKHSGYKIILERWHKDDNNRKCLSDLEWTEEQIIQHDELALEDHSYIATTKGKNS